MTITTGTFLSDLATSSTQVMDGLSPVIGLVIGMLLAFWLLSFIVSLLQNNNDDETMMK